MSVVICVLNYANSGDALDVAILVFPRSLAIDSFLLACSNAFLGVTILHCIRGTIP